jgi:glycosyltransferase involved in cell wall biosynthesis
MQAESWSIIILAYNEGESIKMVIDNLISLLRKFSLEYEIIVVNDGSLDNTKQTLSKYYIHNDKMTIINHEKNLGIGYSLVEAYKIARKDIIGMIPGDGQFDIELLGEAIQTFQKDKDLKIVSFYRDINTIYSSIRKIVTKIQKGINVFILGIHFKDVNWVKFFRKDVLNRRDFCMKSSLIETEIIYIVTLRKYKYIELPSSYLNRGTPRSKLSFLKSLLLASKDSLNLVKLRKYYKKNRN